MVKPKAAPFLQSMPSVFLLRRNIIKQLQKNAVLKCRKSSAKNKEKTFGRKVDDHFRFQGPSTLGLVFLKMV